MKWFLATCILWSPDELTNLSVLTVNQRTTIVAPKGQAVTIDGQINDDEWNGAYLKPLTGGGEIRLLYDGTNLSIGLKGTAKGWSHLYIADNDRIYILHASAALGAGIYDKGTNDSWQLSQAFKWALRQRDFSDESKKARGAFLVSEGWIANNNNMGSGQELEYKIGQKFIKDSRLLIGVVYASDAKVPQYWPETMSDDCLKEDLIFGNTPADLKFNTSGWAEIRILN
jgi:hypothetical protein